MQVFWPGLVYPRCNRLVVRLAAFVLFTIELFLPLLSIELILQSGNRLQHGLKTHGYDFGGVHFAGDLHHRPQALLRRSESVVLPLPGRRRGERSFVYY